VEIQKYTFCLICDGNNCFVNNLKPLINAQKQQGNSTMRCHQCGHKNASGILVCVKCHALLVEDALPKTVNIGQVADLGKPDKNPPRAKEHYEMPEALIFYIEGHPPIEITLGIQLVLGRQNLNTAAKPSLDLTPYNGLDCGVSRMHLIIKQDEGRLVVEDMASSNGTWLQNIRLKAYHPTPLNSEDSLLLGKLLVKVVFKYP
jgi:FHA domain